MKKTKLIVTVSGILCAMALVGCNATVTMNESAPGEPLSFNIEVSETAGAASATNIVSVTNAANTTNTMNNTADTNLSVNMVNTNQTEYVTQTDYACGDTLVAYSDGTEVSEGGYEINFNYQTDEAGYEYAVVSGTKEDGTGWTYQTKKVEIGQYCTMQWINDFGGLLYLNEGGNIIALDVTTGKVVWQNSEYVGGDVLCAADEIGNVYIVGNDTVGMVIIDTKGNTSLKVDRFADYYMPWNTYITGDTLVILYDDTDSARVEFNIKDYSYTVQ